MLKKLVALGAIICIMITPLFGQTTTWKFNTGGRIYSSPFADEDKVYFGSGDHFVYAVKKGSGELAWKFETDGPVHSSPAQSDNFILIGSGDGNLYCLDRKKGKLKWKFESEGEKSYGLWDYYLSSPRISNGVVYWGSGDGNLYAIDVNSGQKKWNFQTEDIIHATPSIHNGKVFIGSFDGYFYALNEETGELVWKFNTVGNTYFPKGEVQKEALIIDDIVYFGSRDYNIYALDTETGMGKWNMKEFGSWIIARPTSFNGNIYFGTSDTHNFYCMEAKSGKILWKISLNMRVYGSAVAYNNTIYFGSFNGKVYGIDPLSGEVTWEFQTEASRENYFSIYDESDHFQEGFELYGEDWEESEKKIHTLGSVLGTPLIENGKIYFGSSDGNFYAVRIE
jgi:outer membrane protein assembly factor BamB